LTPSECCQNEVRGEVLENQNWYVDWKWECSEVHRAGDLGGR